ncbi:MAG: lytic transglycosylase domain-containing protein [Parvularculaceae bacterium]
MTSNAIAGATGANAAIVTTALQRAGAATGVRFEFLLNMARRESGLDPGARAATSSAAGLFQFVEQTWLAAVKAYGARHGLARFAAEIIRGADGTFTVANAARKDEILDMRFDPAASAALAGELAKENAEGLRARLGREVSEAELYAAHFLGVSGAARLLSADSSARAAALTPKAAAANRAVFFDEGRARTVGEVMASFEKSMNARGAARAQAPESIAPARSALTAQPAEALREFERAPHRSHGASLAFSRPRLSPLVLAVLQALDPARLGVGRRDD